MCTIKIDKHFILHVDFEREGKTLSVIKSILIENEKPANFIEVPVFTQTSGKL